MSTVPTVVIQHSRPLRNHEIELVILRDSEETNIVKDLLRKEYSFKCLYRHKKKLRGKNAVQL